MPRSYTGSVRRSSIPKHLTLAGSLAIFLGLAIRFLDVRFLLDTFIWLIGAGIVLAFVGVVSWSPRFPKVQRATFAALLFVAGMSVSFAAARNIHGAGLLFFLGVPALGLALVLVAITIVVPSRR
jgi:hypothetical protein